MGGLISERNQHMSTIDTTPTPEFLEAYHRITGSNDTDAAAVFAAVYSTAALNQVSVSEIQRLHAMIAAEIRRAKEAKPASD
jgi:hypothetical protein